MLDAVRRWLKGAATLPGWSEFSAWAQANHWTMKRTIAHDGWAMSPLSHPAAHPGWRIEWGPSQRSFMSSHEFRIRFDATMPDVQAMVLDRPLLARLDHEVYQQFTGSVQTRLDEETPEEMRWLAMHAKLSPNDLGPLLRDRYGAIATEREWLAAWLAGPVGAALKARADAMPIEAVSAEPFLLRLARGQVVVRQAAAAPRLASLEACVAVAEAVERALRSPG
jgi:hypothetical protein